MKEPGRKPFIIAAVCCGLMSAYMGLPINAAGVFLTPVSDDLGFLRGTFSFHMTILSLVNGFSALAVPAVFRRFRMKTVYWTSFAVSVLATFAMGRVSTIPAFYALSAVRGFFGCLTCMVPVNMTLHNWFVKDLGKVSSVVFASTGLSGILGTQVLSRVIDAWGWRTGYTVMTALIALFALPALLYPFRMNPAEMGMRAYGQSEAGDDAGTGTDSEPEAGVFRTPRFAMLMVVSVFICFNTGMAQHFPGYAGTLGLAAAGAVMMSIAMGANVTFKFMTGFLSDRFGARAAAILLSIVCLAGLLLLAVSSAPAGLYAGTVLYGTCYSVGAVMLSLLTVYYFRRADYDRVYMYTNAMGSTGTAISLTVIGYIYDFTRSYRPALVLCMVLTVISILALMLVKPPQRK